jgi:hypothetical protein
MRRSLPVRSLQPHAPHGGRGCGLGVRGRILDVLHRSDIDIVLRGRGGGAQYCDRFPIRQKEGIPDPSGHEADCGIALTGVLLEIHGQLRIAIRDVRTGGPTRGGPARRSRSRDAGLAEERGNERGNQKGRPQTRTNSGQGGSMAAAERVEPPVLGLVESRGTSRGRQAAATRDGRVQDLIDRTLLQTVEQADSSRGRSIDLNGSQQKTGTFSGAPRFRCRAEMRTSRHRTRADAWRRDARRVERRSPSPDARG